MDHRRGPTGGAYPARVAARASRGRHRVAADDVLEAPETARILDQALAGSLPEKLAQSIVRHHVLERMAAQLAASGELDKLVNQALQSPQMRDALRTVASSPEVRAAIARQSAGLAEEVVGEARAAAARMDGRIGRTAGRARLCRPCLPGDRARGRRAHLSSSSSPRGSGSSR